jgi:hypothetical protein
MKKPSTGRSRPGKQLAENHGSDHLPWPGYRAQQELMASLMSPAEHRAAQERAQVLVTHGWGALEGWLEQQSEQPTAGCRRAAVDSLADLFDVA